MDRDNFLIMWVLTIGWIVILAVLAYHIKMKNPIYKWFGRNYGLRKEYICFHKKWIILIIGGAIFLLLADVIATSIVSRI